MHRYLGLPLPEIFPSLDSSSCNCPELYLLVLPKNEAVSFPIDVLVSLSGVTVD